MAKIAEVREVEPKLLKFYENNAKIHGKEQIKKLKDSIEEFGFLTPCLIDRDYNLIAGHGRVMAALELNMQTVPCVFIEGLSETQRRAYILADNRLGELGEWDMVAVNEELQALADDGFSVLTTGFDFEVDTADITEEEPYTKVVNIPQYEPSAEEVTLGDCVDTTKYDQLVKEINASSLDEDDKAFLRLAAARHIVFSYKKIADYYASASAEMQKLMEKSALVIIDVEDAIAYWYAELKSYLDEIEERDYGEE